MEQLLIVEDDKELNQGLCKALKAENRQIFSCRNMKSACLLWKPSLPTIFRHQQFLPKMWRQKRIKSKP